MKNNKNSESIAIGYKVITQAKNIANEQSIEKEKMNNKEGMTTMIVIIALAALIAVGVGIGTIITNYGLNAVIHILELTAITYLLVTKNKK